MSELDKWFTNDVDDEAVLAVLDVVGRVFEPAWCRIETRKGNDGRPVAYLEDRLFESPEHGRGGS